MLKVDGRNGWVVFTDAEGSENYFKYKDISGFYISRSGYKEVNICIFIVVGGVRQCISQYYSANIKDHESLNDEATNDFRILTEYITELK